MPKSSPNMHVKQEVSTRVKPRLLCKQSMGQNTPNDYNDGWLKFSPRVNLSLPIRIFKTNLTSREKQVFQFTKFQETHILKTITHLLYITQNSKRNMQCCTQNVKPNITILTQI